MAITFLLTCHVAGDHLSKTLESLYLAAEHAGYPVTIRVLTPLSRKVIEGMAGNRCRLVDLDVFETAPIGGILAKFDEFLGSSTPKSPESIYVFSNDDVVYAVDFVEQLLQQALDRKIVGPLIRTPAGAWQTSMFRKDFTFWKLILRIYDGGLYSKLFRPQLRLDRINMDRKTIDGCCFIMNEATLSVVGRQFGFVAFLYMEEVIFQYWHEKFQLKPFVSQDLKIVHLGGATIAHQWTRARSKIQRQSVAAVSKAYLHHTLWQTALLRVYYAFEGFVRIVLGALKW